MFGILGKKGATCGLDIGNRGVKLVRLKPGKLPELDAVGFFPWKGQEAEQKAQSGKKIKSIFSDLAIKDKVVNSSLNGHSIIIKRVTFQAESLKKLDKVIEEEAKQYIPFDINDVYMDYHLLEGGSKDSGFDVFLVATKKSALSSLEEILSEAGLNLSIVDVNVFALCNCYEYNYNENLADPVFLFEVGASQSVICAYANGKPQMVRDIPIGGNQITNAIAKYLNIPLQKAEVIKLNGPADGQDAAGIQTEIDKVLDVWINELRRVINLYKASFADLPVPNQLYLAGGGILGSGAREFVSNNLALQCELMNPWRKLKVNAEKFDKDYLLHIGPQLAVPMGLALRALG